MQTSLQQLLWTVAALMVLTTVAANEIFVGELQLAAVRNKDNGTNSNVSSSNSSNHIDEHCHHQHFLRLKSGELRMLKFPKEPQKLPRSGARVMVRTTARTQCGIKESSNAMCVGSLAAQEEATRDMFAAGQPRGKVNIKTLVMQLQVCGQGPATSIDNLAGALYDNEPTSQPETVQGMFTTCSYGNAQFGKSLGSEIVSASIPIPCTGKTSWGAPYDSSTCPFTEWSDVANDYVKHVLGYNWQDFKYKIYVVPPGDLCSWGGMGWVGCKSDCRAWISGDLWQFPTTWMHELGHNLYLNHAGSFQRVAGTSQYVAYKDDSSAMGHCCSTRCFNAPHSFQLGWSKPIDALHKDNLSPGEWVSYILPPHVGPNSKDTNMIKIWPDWDGPSAAYNIFVEYRHAVSYDAGLYSTVKDKVTVYSTSTGDAMPFTTLEAAIGEHQIMHESRIGSKLAVWVGDVSEGGIRVNLCRPSVSGAEECGNGKDDDCDGLIDEEDSDCQISRRMLKG